VEEILQRLAQRVADLGRHYERFLVTIAANIAQLIERLEQHSMMDDVELWNLAASPGEQMQAVRSIGADLQEKLDLMATYYSLQLIHMNLLALDRLDLALSDREGRIGPYRHFLESQGANYQRLNAVYIDNLLGLFLADKVYPEFCICVVGTRSDQDDVDILVVHAEGEGADNLNRALGKLVAEFFKRAGRLHLYIAEQIRIRGFSATVDEYAAILSKDLTDFVMICELLSAEPLVGSWNIFSQFKRKVIDRFFGKNPRWRRYHAAFLRGLLGEMHALLVADVSREHIEFKTDALRLAKGMTLAGKVVRDIREVNPVVVLDELCRQLRPLQEELEAVRESLLFVETFRLLYHMLVVEEEIVEFDGGSDEVLDKVAAAMGYSEQGGVSAANHLIVHYFESVERIRIGSRKLMTVLARYVGRVSGYALLSSDSGKRSRNVASELADSVRTFHGHLFFEDILAALKEEDGKLAAKLVGDAEKLKGKRRDAVIESYLEFAFSDPMTLIELMLTIRDVPGDGSKALFETMTDRFLDRMEESEGFLPGFLAVYNNDPALFNRFIEVLATPQRERLEQLLEVNAWDDEQREALQRLKKYIWLRTAGSEFYRRIFRRVINRYPHFIRYLGEAERLRRYASGFLAYPEDGFDATQAREALGDYYDVAYLACAIEALDGVELDDYRSSFTEFIEIFMSSLYTFCRKLAMRKTGTRVETRDLFGLFASGGFARGQAFDDDYDLILILNSDDPSIFSFFRKLSSLLHRELVRSGTLPQYRFSDHFGEFVVRFSQMKEWFASGQADAVDKTQLLGARMLVGNSRFLSQINNEIVAPYIIARFDEFAIEMAEEMDSRQQAFSGCERAFLNIKEGPGGLRDIEQVLLIMKAKYDASEPISEKLFRDLSVFADAHKQALADLKEHHAFLRRVRDLYRLGVAAHDDMTVDELAIVAGIVGVVDANGDGDGEMLARMVRERMRKVAKIVAKLVLDQCGYKLPTR